MSTSPVVRPLPGPVDRPTHDRTSDRASLRKPGRQPPGDPSRRRSAPWRCRAAGRRADRRGDAGTWVVNKHAPTRQIWLSSPKSGARHYAFDAAVGPVAGHPRRRRPAGDPGGRAGRRPGVAARHEPLRRPAPARAVPAAPSRPGGAGAAVAAGGGRHGAGLRRLPARPDRSRLRAGPAGCPELRAGLAAGGGAGAGDRLGRALLPGVVAGRAGGRRPAARPVRPCRAARAGLVRDQALGRRDEPHLLGRPADRAGDRLVGVGGAAQHADVRRRHRHAGDHQPQARAVGAGGGAGGGGADHHLRPQGAAAVARGAGAGRRHGVGRRRDARRGAHRAGLRPGRARRRALRRRRPSGRSRPRSRASAGARS